MRDAEAALLQWTRSVRGSVGEVGGFWGTERTEVGWLSEASSRDTATQRQGRADPDAFGRRPISSP